MLKATLDTSDWHYGDSAQLYETMRECFGRAVDVMLAQQPDEIDIVLNGDAVAGRGIYRDQGLQAALQFGAEQCWWAAWDIRRWQAKMPKAQWQIIRGNHDSANKENLAAQLVMILRLLGVPAVYYSRAHVGNFSPDENNPYWYDAQHGFGASSYYATSYDGIRSCWRTFIERAIVDNIHLRRFLRGHTHWLNQGQTIGFEVAIDTTGGWHRQEREKLSGDTRNTGVMLYLHDGKELTVKPIEADRKLLLEETYSPTLHYRTAGAAAQALTEATEWAHDNGML